MAIRDFPICNRLLLDPGVIFLAGVLFCRRTESRQTVLPPLRRPVRPRPRSGVQLILAHLERASCSLDLGPDAPPGYERAREWPIREGHHLGVRVEHII